MVEPLAVGVHACRRGGVAPGRSVAVLGAGPIGLLAMQAAAAYGAAPVICSDVLATRLARAESLGAVAVNAGSSDPVAAVRAATGGDGPDVVIETAGDGRHHCAGDADGAYRRSGGAGGASAD